jgi:hypothetical protein
MASAAEAGGTATVHSAGVPTTVQRTATLPFGAATPPGEPFWTPYVTDVKVSAPSVRTVTAFIALLALLVTVITNVPGPVPEGTVMLPETTTRLAPLLVRPPMRPVTKA